MTLMNRSDVIPMNSGVTAGAMAVSDRMSVFIADELIPLMAGYWPKSSNQLNSNLRGNAMAYGVMLKGFSANAIREAITDLADKNPDRDFAPPPQELKKLCLVDAQPASQVAKFIASMSSLEMQICTKCLSGQIEKTQQAVDAELNAMIESVYAKGGEVVGSRGFAPLKSIIRG